MNVLSCVDNQVLFAYIISPPILCERYVYTLTDSRLTPKCMSITKKKKVLNMAAFIPPKKLTLRAPERSQVVYVAITLW